MILPDHQREIDVLILDRQRMLAEAAPLTNAPPSPTRQRPDVDLTEVNHIQDELLRVTLCICEVLCRALNRAAAVMSPDYYQLVLRRLRLEQADEHRKQRQEAAHWDGVLARMTLDPLIQNWPAPGPWSF